MQLSETEARRRATGSDHGVLSTLHPERGVDAVPVCFVIDGDLVAVGVDRIKPKASTDLQRTRNLEADPRGSLLCEHWNRADWSRLWWVRLSVLRSAEESATVARLAALLRAKYPQYAAAEFDAVLTFRIVAVSGWSAS